MTNWKNCKTESSRKVKGRTLFNTPTNSDKNLTRNSSENSTSTKQTISPKLKILKKLFTKLFDEVLDKMRKSNIKNPKDQGVVISNFVEFEKFFYSRISTQIYDFLEAKGFLLENCLKSKSF